MHTATKTIRLAACVALVWFLSGAFARAQTTDSTQARSFPSREAPSSRETEYQRWIPLDASQGKSQNPLELLARLQKRSKPTGNPFSWSQLQQAFQNNPGLSEQLQNLSPSQREQLKQLAQSFSQQAFPDGPPKSIDDLPPALRQQMESSPELRKLAEELARTQSSSGAPRGDDSTPGATSPELTEAELEKAVRDLFENKIDSPNDAPDRSRGNSNAPGVTDKNGANGMRRDNNANDPSGPKGGEPSPNSPPDARGANRLRAGEQPDAPNRSNNPSRDGAPSVANNNANDEQGSEEEFQRAELERIQRRWDEIQRQRALAEQRLQQRQSSSNRNGIQPPDNNSKTSSTGGRTESSVDLIQRKLRELGLSSFLQQIAKEAVGVEQQQLDGSQDSVAESDDPTTSSPNKPPRTRTRPPQSTSSSKPLSQEDLDLNEGSKRWGDGIAGRRPANSSGWFNDKESSLGGVRSSNQREEPEDAPEKSEESPFSLPKLGELPSLPIWFWVVPLSLGLFVLAVYLLPRSQAILDRLSGRSADEARRAEAMLGEIEGREDAVRAFHWILEKKVRGFESWWTSRKVVEHVRHREEPLQPQVAQAAELYDLARYTPETYDLDKSELERMRQAIRACASAETIG